MTQKIYFGHKERHGSAFLTSFSFSYPVDVEKFIQSMDKEVRRLTQGLTKVRLTKIDNDPLENNKFLDRVEWNPLITIWWGGDTGAEDPAYTRLGSVYWVQEYFTMAVQTIAKQMGYQTQDMQHSSKVLELETIVEF